jgi:hypothetical protein
MTLQFMAVATVIVIIHSHIGSYEKLDQHIRSSLIPFYRIQFTMSSFQVSSHNLCISIFSNSIVEMNCSNSIVEYCMYVYTLNALRFHDYIIFFISVAAVQ